MIFYHRPLIGQLTATRMGRNNTSKDMDKSIEINFKEPSPKAQVNWKEKTMSYELHHGYGDYKHGLLH